MLATTNTDRRTKRREATKAEIIDAAWELARENGLAGLALRDLAGRVGMQAPSLYSYFDSKNAIYDAMFAQGCAEYLARQSTLILTGEAAHDLKAGAHSFIEFCAEEPARYQLMFQRTIPGFEPSPDSYALAIEALEITSERLRSFGITSPRQLDIFTAICSGLADQQIANDPGGDRWIRLIDDAIDMYLAHAKPKKPSRRRAR